MTKTIHDNGGGRSTSDVIVTTPHGVDVMVPSLGKGSGDSDSQVIERFA